ncbi:redoxin family protein [Herbidospora sp. NBRC 101105]|uniref:TlpA family protein disulfide reductase n=1 Tax=Herbidospora sp. NBRC 101105 TaxID=3032195 RepID=UPI0024A49937|nr:redoxin family protein [Herbidospora sp. NBRC 101105]GLX97305.1 thiol:disulfide interchange protein [Herbidospora sp. NBRC 101105]
MKSLTSLLTAAALVLTACGGPSGDPVASAPSASAEALLGFTATELDGTAFDGRSLAGKPAVLWFWAPWCPKCQAEGPAVAKAAQKYGGRVVFVGVAGLDDDKAAMERFVARTGTSGIVHLDDRTGALYRNFEVTSQSSYLILNARGGAHSAVGPLDEAELSALVDEHAL